MHFHHCLLRPLPGRHAWQCVNYRGIPAGLATSRKAQRHAEKSCRLSLTGKDRDLASPDAGSRFAAGKAAGLPAAQLAVARVLALPGVSCAIVGASRAQQLQPSLAAMDTKLEAGLLARLDELTREFRMGDAVR